jgi:hypothetical protein
VPAALPDVSTIARYRPDRRKSHPTNTPVPAGKWMNLTGHLALNQGSQLFDAFALGRKVHFLEKFSVSRVVVQIRE